MARVRSGPNPIILLACLVVLVLVGGTAGLYFLFSNPEDSSPAGLDPTRDIPVALPAETQSVVTDKAAGLGERVEVGLPTPGISNQETPLPELPWQADGLTDIERVVDSSLRRIQDTAPEAAIVLASLPWVGNEMTLEDRLAVPVIAEIALADPDLAARVVNLPWLADDLLEDHELSSLNQLNSIAAIESGLAKSLVDAPFQEGGISLSEQLTLVVVLDVAEEDLALARKIANSPEVADGINVEEMASLTGTDSYFLDALERDHPAVAEVVHGYSWLPLGISRHQELQATGTGLLAFPLSQQRNRYLEQLVISRIKQIAETDESLALRVAAYWWLEDGVTRYESWTVYYIARLAEVNLGLAKTLADFGWLEGTTTGGVTTWEVASVAATILRLTQLDADAAELLLNQAWLQDDLTEEEFATVITISTGCTVRPIVSLREIIENRQAESRMLHLASESLKVIVVSRSGTEREVEFIFQETRVAIEAIQEIMGRPWPNPRIIVYLEPDYKYISDASGFYAGSHIMISRADPGSTLAKGTLYHELAHYYLHRGPRWLSEGGSNFLEAYVFYLEGRQSMEARASSLEGRVPCDGSENIHQRNLATSSLTYNQWLPIRGCDYLLGERFLLGTYLELGHELVSSSLRDLYLGGAGGSAITEEAIYQVFYSNASADRQDEFRNLYLRLHGRPVGTDPPPTPTPRPTPTPSPTPLPGYLSDLNALNVFFHATGGDNWLNSSNWLTNAPLDQWHGISTDENGRVSVLDLHENGLTGKLPPELGDLGELEHLIVWSNQLTGGLPHELTRLSRLKNLSVGNNLLSGDIPTWLGSMNSLEILHLTSNRFTGQIPEELTQLTNLRLIYIYGDELTGCIPTGLRQVEDNDFMYLEQYTRITFCDAAPLPTLTPTPLPAPLIGDPAEDRRALVTLYNATGGPNWENSVNWLTNAPLNEWYGVTTSPGGLVVGLNLEGNGLEGAIPRELGELHNLEILNLGYNRFSGTIPPDLGVLPRLKVLNLTNAGREGGLTGTIPPEMGNLTNLNTLYLGGHELSGELPSELARLHKLEQLVLWENRLSGPIPAWLGNLTDLVRLELWDNQFTGPIPSELGNLTRMGRLQLDHNRLSGPIPESLGDMAELELVHLNGNEFTGCLPPSWQSAEHNDFRLVRLPFCVGDEGSVETSVIDDRHALVTLYHATDGPNWVVSNIPDDSHNWLSNRPLGEWLGVETDMNGRVIGLNVHRFGLTGSIPPELGGLTEIEALILSNNRLRGSLPPELSQLSNLRYLDLAFNQLSGEIPSELGRLIGLSEVNLIENQFTGCMPANWKYFERLEFAQYDLEFCEN